MCGMVECKLICRNIVELRGMTVHYLHHLNASIDKMIHVKIDEGYCVCDLA